ncbi:MAG: TraR/DksA C4-type zinc finger protein [Bryobacterales bacterium]|nr:TraR/DksA C4-type zinc finger protein [Bryobacterales bacterium]
MTKQQLDRFRQILQEKESDLLQVVRKRDEIAIEKTPDALDEVQRAAERELAIRNLDRESRLLREVRAALRRIEDGSYGTCIYTGEEISMKRLEAVPWTPFCLKAQELFDRNEAEAVETFEDAMANAA